MTPEPREGGGSERTGRASVLLPRRLRPPSVARSRLLVSFSRTALLPLLFSSLRCFHCRERACCASRSCSCSLPRLRSPLPPTVSSSPLATTTRSSGLLPSPVTLPPPPEATQSATPASSRCTVRPSVSLFPLPRERHADRPHRRTSGPRLPRFPGRRTTCGRHRRCGQELGLAVVQGALAAAALCGRAGDGTSTSALAGSPLPPCTNYGRAQALSVLMGALAASGEGLVGHVELKHRVRRPLSSRSRPFADNQRGRLRSRATSSSVPSPSRPSLATTRTTAKSSSSASQQKTGATSPSQSVACPTGCTWRSGSGC